MTTFIADFIFGKRDRRPRSRPSPAERLVAQLRLPARLQPDAPPADAHGEAESGSGRSRRSAGPRRSGDGLAG